MKDFCVFIYHLIDLRNTKSWNILDRLEIEKIKRFLRPVEKNGIYIQIAVMSLYLAGLHLIFEY